MQNKIRQQKLVFLGLFLLLLFTYPFITIANRLALVAGFPVLLLYIFTVWIAGIIVLYIITDKQRRKPPDE